MNNEPVAWNEEEFNHIAYSYRSWPSTDPIGVSERYDELVNYVQSITHPAKTLTDEEIWQITEDFWKRDWTTLDVGFARAILRKAQEK